MAAFAVGYQSQAVLALTKALGIPESVPVCAIDIRIRPDEIIMATVQIPASNEALAELESVASLSEGRIVLVSADEPTVNHAKR